MPQVTPEVTPEVSIIIPTFRRPDWLRDTLESCLPDREAGPGAAGPDFEIVVVDNCPDRSAAEVVAAGAAGAPVAVRYVHEPRSGVSHARNSGVRDSRAPFIAFIDDDELAEPGWLAALLAAQRRFDADVVWGPVRARTEGVPAAPADFVTDFYSRDFDLPTGPIAKFQGAGNSLIRRAGCLDGPEPFDLRMNFSGGEDDLLFERLQRLGRRFIWCREAPVIERVPVGRTSYAHLWWRSFRKGQGPSVIAALGHPAKPVAVLRWMAIGAGQGVVYGAAALALWAVRSPRAPFLTALAIAGAGKVLWMWPFRPDFYGSAGRAKEEAAEG